MRTTQRLNHDGVDYLPGEAVTGIPEDVALALLESGVLELVTEKEEESTGSSSLPHQGTQNAPQAPSAPTTGTDDAAGSGDPSLDSEIEEAFPSEAEILGMTAKDAAAYVVEFLKLDAPKGNAAEIKAATVELVRQAKAQLYADKAAKAGE